MRAGRSYHACRTGIDPGMTQWHRVLTAVVFGTAASTFAQVRSREAPVPPPRFEAAPVIDARLDDAAWTTAARLEGFRQVQPGDPCQKF